MAPRRAPRTSQVISSQISNYRELVYSPLTVILKNGSSLKIFNKQGFITATSVIEKLQYLKLSLEGEAASAIATLEITGDNYEIAWNLIKERFENKSLLTHNHICSTVNLQKITKESHVLLHQLLDNVQKHLRALSNVGEPTEHWNSIIIFLVSSKLDPSTAREWKVKKSLIDTPKCTNFFEFLKGRADMLESLHLAQTPQKQEMSKFKDKAQTPPRKAFLAIKNPICNFCKGAHRVYACEQFLKLTTPDKINKVKSLRLCLNCLGNGHLIKDCKSSSCRTCNGKHHTLLHLSKSTTADNHASSASTSSVASHPSASPTLAAAAETSSSPPSASVQPCHALVN